MWLIQNKFKYIDILHFIERQYLLYMFYFVYDYHAFTN